MKVVSNETMSIVLDGLDRYTAYRIEVWGETVKGGGPVATTFAGNISHGLWHCPISNKHEWNNFC